MTREEIPPGILEFGGKDGIFGDVPLREALRHPVQLAAVITNPRRYPPPPRPPLTDAEIEGKAAEAVRRGYR